MSATAAVTVEVLFGKPGDHFGTVAAHFTARLVDRDDLARNAESAIVRIDDVLGERRNPALAGWIRT